MNNNTNNKSEIEASQAKQKFVSSFEQLCVSLGQPVPEVTYSEVESAPTETLTWVNFQTAKLDKLIAAVDAK